MVDPFRASTAPPTTLSPEPNMWRADSKAQKLFLSDNNSARSPNTRSPERCTLSLGENASEEIERSCCRCRPSTSRQQFVLAYRRGRGRPGSRSTRYSLRCQKGQGTNARTLAAFLEQGLGHPSRRCWNPQALSFPVRSFAAVRPRRRLVPDWLPITLAIPSPVVERVYKESSLVAGVRIFIDE